MGFERVARRQLWSRLSAGSYWGRVRNCERYMGTGLGAGPRGGTSGLGQLAMTLEPQGLHL